MYYFQALDASIFCLKISGHQRPDPMLLQNLKTILASGLAAISSLLVPEHPPFALKAERQHSQHGDGSAYGSSDHSEAEPGRHPHH